MSSAQVVNMRRSHRPVHCATGNPWWTAVILLCIAATLFRQHQHVRCRRLALTSWVDESGTLPATPGIPVRIIPLFAHQVPTQRRPAQGPRGQLGAETALAVKLPRHLRVPATRSDLSVAGQTPSDSEPPPTRKRPASDGACVGAVGDQSMASSSVSSTSKISGGRTNISLRPLSQTTSI